MKGWQNQLQYAQKINCSKEMAAKIIAFESFEYLDGWEGGLIKLSVPFSDCFNLQHLIDSLKLNFIKIYKGQVLIIANEILQHLQQLHSNNLNNLSHGQLLPKNIFISLKNIKDNKLNVYQVPIYIKKINFINYKSIEDQNYEINQMADIHQIIKCLQLFIESIEDYQQCQLLQFINKEMQVINSNLNQYSLQLLGLLFNKLIAQNVDQKTQQIMVGEFRESPNYESFLGMRYRSEAYIIKYLKQLSIWDLYQQIEIQVNEIKTSQNQTDIYQNQIYLKEEDQTNNEHFLEIKSILQNCLRNTITKQYWALLGEELNKTFGNINSAREQFQSRTNNNLSQLPQWNEKIKTSLSQFENDIPDSIIKQISIQFKFDFEISPEVKLKIAQLFIQQLQISFQEFDLFNGDFDLALNEIKDNIKKEIKYHFDELQQIKILELIADLI